MEIERFSCSVRPEAEEAFGDLDKKGQCRLVAKRRRNITVCLVLNALCHVYTSSVFIVCLELIDKFNIYEE
jgi:hypothetical protein